jgi:hypothetical protein
MYFMTVSLVGQFGCGNPVVARVDVIGGRGGFASGVGGAQRDDGGEQEGRAGQQGALESSGERGAPRGVRCKFATEKPRSRLIDGRATFMVDESATSRNCTAHSSRVSLPRPVARNEAGSVVTG